MSNWSGCYIYAPFREYFICCFASFFYTYIFYETCDTTWSIIIVCMFIIIYYVWWGKNIFILFNLLIVEVFKCDFNTGVFCEHMRNDIRRGKDDFGWTVFKDSTPSHNTGPRRDYAVRQGMFCTTYTTIFYWVLMHRHLFLDKWMKDGY